MSSSGTSSEEEGDVVDDGVQLRAPQGVDGGGRPTSLFASLSSAVHRDAAEPRRDASVTTPLLGAAVAVAEKRRPAKVMREKVPTMASGSRASSSSPPPPARAASPSPSLLPPTSRGSRTVDAAPPCAALLASATARRVAEGSLSGAWIAPRLPPHSYLSDLLTNAGTPAITPTDTRRSLTHADLRELIHRVDDEELKSWGVRRCGSRIGVAVPNGPELMAVLLAVMERHVAVPVNPATTSQEMHVELKAAGVTALIYQGGGESEGAMQALCAKLGIIPLIITPDATRGGAFTLLGDPYRTDGPGPSTRNRGDWAYAGHDAVTPRSLQALGGETPDPLRTALVLHTSGSTGQKKIVPISTRQLVLGAVAIAASTGLSADDVCLNFMPMFHVGGVCRNLLAPLLSGGSTVAMPFFDVDDFWTAAVERHCTWYYGAPTMHMLIVRSAATMVGGAPATKIRFVANAAGPLSPSVAIQIRETFPGAAVLTSYGMTECMPITCPPPGYKLERAGSSGQAICPEVAIVDDAGERVSNGRVAHIVVRGDVVTKGYENDSAATANSFFPGGWFKTGDMGWMDSDGYLYVTGRSKEVINRGGEIISPAEVEEALLAHPGVADVVAISVPHATLQETVGVVVVPTEGVRIPGLRQLCAHVADRLPPAKWPQVLVLVQSIPRLGATGKISRTSIAKSLDLSEVRNGMSELDVTFQADLTAKTGMREIATREDATARVAAVLVAASGIDDAAAVVDTTGTNAIIGAVTPATADAREVMRHAAATLPGFLDPQDIIALDVIPRDAHGKPDAQALLALWKGHAAAKNTRMPLTPSERRVLDAWAETLKLDARTIGVDDDFFQMGGSSLVAGQLAAAVRRTLGSALTGADIFRYRTVKQIAAKIEKEALVKEASSGSGGDTFGANGVGGSPPGISSKPLGPMDWTYHFSPTSASAMFLQSLPLLLFAPLQKIVRWAIFLNAWSACIHALHPSINFVHHISAHTFIAPLVRLVGVDLENQHFHHLRLVAFFAALIITAVLSTILFPLIAVAMKWTILGKLRPGLHPLWGQYYLRWWLANKALEVTGSGMFAATETSYRWFLRLNGANIGHGAKVGRLVHISECDMITIHVGATVDDYAHVRAAEVRRGALRVAPVYIGANATVCTRAIVGPGGIVPAGATLGPYMSWRELDVTARGAAAQMEEHKKLARMRQPQPNSLSTLAAWPLVMCAEAIVWVPWVVVFILLIRSHQHQSNLFGENEFTTHSGTGNKTHDGDTTSSGLGTNNRYIDGGQTSLTAAHSAAFTSRHLLEDDGFSPGIVYGHGHRYSNLVVERGEYMRLTPTARLGHSQLQSLGTADPVPPLVQANGLVDAPMVQANGLVDAPMVQANGLVDVEAARNMFVHCFYYGDPLFATLDAMTWKDCITWFMDPFRLGVIFAARIGHSIFGPLIQMTFIILIKWVVVGKFRPGPLPRVYAAREWELTRRWLMNKLIPDGSFRGAVGVLGKHYDYTSYMYRALGASIGRRVFWPGSGVYIADGMFDLLEVGDDVVWGSRSLVYPGDADGALPVRVGRGANVADRCVLYAGTTLMDDACLGSGGVSRRGSTFDFGSIWVGSRNGAAVQLDPGSKTRPAYGTSDRGVSPRTAKPFGRAVYQGKASYFLPPWQTMPLIASAVIALRTLYAVIPIWVSWYLVAIITWDLGNNFWTEMPEWRYLLLLVVVYLWVHMMHTVARFIADVALKWLVIGRRKPGLYPWDRSSYCLRWKMLEMVCSDTSKDLRLLGGSAFLPFYYNVVGAKIGRRVCLYPTGADPPMVEPDLVVIEDLACINFAHIICHTNTLGSFALNTIVVKSGATLSTESRVMGGVVIGEDAVLLEHTLAMVGDQVEPETIWQGWPVHTIARVDEVNSADHSHHAPASAPANPLYSPRGRVEDVDATRSGPDAASAASLAGLRGGGGNDVSNYHSSYGMV